jgi:serine protease
MKFDRCNRVVSAIGATLVCLTPLSSLSQTDEGPPQRVIVKWRDAGLLNARRVNATEALERSSARVGASMQRVRTTATGAEVVRANRRLSRAELDDLVRTLASDPDVEYAEEDVLQKRYVVPNDARYSEQWHYYETRGGLNLPSAWDASTGVDVTVAVLDTGYRPHADLADNLWPGYDFISDTFIARDGNGRDSDARDPGDWTLSADCPPDSPYDSSWHGTHVAGTIAAETNNSQGVAGVAFGARVLPVRVLGRCGALTSDISDAIIWAAGGSVPGVPTNPNPARVINMSLGTPPGGTCSSTQQAAINEARSRGTVVIVAAGNDGVNANRVAPANCSGVVVVAATTRSGGKTWYSNYGTIVDVAAPGGDLTGSAANDVWSTLNGGTTVPGSDSYGAYGGTSMATPHVAGVAALMLSQNGTLTPDDVESRLKSSARALPGSCSGGCGAGIVDALAAVNAAIGGGGPGPDPEPGSCPAGYTLYSGTLSRGGLAYAPSTSGSTVAAGVQSGRLNGPASTDFDLYLQRRSGSSWRNVAQGISESSTEAIDYNGSASTYRWRVHAYSGSGAYSLCVRRP